VYLTDSSVDMAEDRPWLGEVKERERAEFETRRRARGQSMAEPSQTSAKLKRWAPDPPHMLRDHK
jgi:hypothetical protein